MPADYPEMLPTYVEMRPGKPQPPQVKDWDLPRRCRLRFLITFPPFISTTGQTMKLKSTVLALLTAGAALASLPASAAEYTIASICADRPARLRRRARKPTP